MEISQAHVRELEKQQQRKEALRVACGTAFAGCSSLFFEAGCGHGHWLTSYAEAHPEQVCVGIDLIALRVRKAQAKGDKRGLRNLHFYKAELGEFLEILPPDIQFDGTVLLFPDPWPKARHHRRRMVQEEMLTEVARRTRPNGCFYFRTDDRAYFDWTLEHLEDNRYWVIDKEAAWPHEKETYFQGLMETYYSVVARLQEVD
jgi:tRNA (guanine-N7-)-methyltransferase